MTVGAGRAHPWVQSAQLRRWKARAAVLSAVPTLPQLWALVCLGGIFIILDLWVVRPHDFWWHVRAGQWIVQQGRLPRTDLFSFTQAGEPWAYQSWLMEVLLYLLLRVGGLPLVICFHALCITAGYALLLRANREAGGDNLRWAVVATLWAAVLGVDNWNVRPQTVSFPLFALILYLIERHTSRSAMEPGGRGDRALWCLPPLFALWANAHGGFILGLGLLGAFLLARLAAWLRGERPFPTDLLLVAALSGGATLLTPLGLGMVDYVLGFLQHPVTRTLNLEFMPPTVRTQSGQLFFGALAAWLALVLVSGHRPSLHASIRLVLFGGLALMAVRNMAWFGFAAAPTMAAALRYRASQGGTARSARLGRPRLNRARVNRGMALLVGLLALLSLPWFRPYLGLPPQRRAYVSSETPVEAVAFLRELPKPLRVFHEMGYGSYMIWASPEVLVFIDTRIELYPVTQWRDYIALNQARYDWGAILEVYGIDTLLLQREAQKELIEAATTADNWELRYEDERSVVFRLKGVR